MLNLTDITIYRDQRNKGYSVMGSTDVENYLGFIHGIFERRGNIEGQRGVIQKPSESRKSERMVKDIAEGAVLPPIVVGVLLDHARYEKLENFYKTKGNDKTVFIDRLIRNVPIYDFSLIDGMQRTNAIIQALRRNPTVNVLPLRIELWLADNLNSLIYRMLVLNTGQSPWDLNRQIDVLYSSMLKNLQERVPGAEFLDADHIKDRNRSGQYPNRSILELYIVFSTRRARLYLKENVTDAYIELDLAERAEKLNLFELFADCFNMLVKFDTLLGSRFNEERVSYGRREKLLISGPELFDSQPARIGFMTAMGLALLGNPGEEIQKYKVETRFREIQHGFHNFLARLESLDLYELNKFMALDFLMERISIYKVRKNKVGDFERDFYTEAFERLIKNDFRVDSMYTCWNAYFD